MDGAPTGRTAELERISGLLDTGGRLLVVGDAGIGKTTVWRAGIDLAHSRGLSVLAAAPAEAERVFSYAVLAELLEPLTRTGLPPRQRDALDAALGAGDGSADAGVVAAAVVSLLRAGAPLLVAVDDVQWADSASTAVLGHALRRLPEVRVLLAARRGHRVGLQLEVERVVLGPLSVGALHHVLVDRLEVRLARTSLRRLHEVTGGNPFYALELSRANTKFPDSLDDLVAARIRALPRPTRRAVAAFALSGLPPRTGLDAAIEAEVLDARGDELRFAHPLLAEAAVALLGPDERRKLHVEAAAAAVDPEQRVRHLAHAAIGPDAVLADELEQAAHAAARRGASAASAELWELAAGLTPGAAPARQVQAGIAHMFAGDIDVGEKLVEAHVEDLPRGSLRDAALTHRALMLAQRDVAPTIPALEAVLSEVDDPRARYTIVRALAAFLHVSGDGERAARIGAAFLREVEGGDDAVLMRALGLSAHLELWRDRPAHHLVERALALDDGDEPEVWMSPWRALGLAHLRDGRYADARVAIERALADLDETGEDIWRGVILRWLVEVELAAGCWTRALELSDEALSHSEQVATPHELSYSLRVHAVASGLIGRVDDARRSLDRALELAEHAHVGMAKGDAFLALGLLELSLGRGEAAAAAYRSVPTPSWGEWLPFAGGRVKLDAIEAFAETGDLARARELAETLPPDAHERPFADALLAPDVDEAIARVRAAEPSPAPYRRAREQLLLGRLLRRARRRADARAVLTDAQAAFERLGAPCWAERAADERARLGGRAPSGNRLTASESRVAELVASGLSNKEVAAELVVTARTVEAHLSKIYAKLGVRSRAALAATWNAHP